MINLGTLNWLIYYDMEYITQTMNIDVSMALKRMGKYLCCKKQEKALYISYRMMLGSKGLFTLN